MTITETAIRDFDEDISWVEDEALSYDQMQENVLASKSKFVAPTGSKARTAMPAFDLAIVSKNCGEFWNHEFVEGLPTLGLIKGGTALIYEGVDHFIAGTAGSGKTFLIMAILVETLVNDEDATGIFIDYESSFSRFMNRLHSIGCTETAANRIEWIKPTGGMMNTTLYGAGLQDWLVEMKPRLVVLDSVAVALSANGMKENDNDEFTAWWRCSIEPMNNAGITSVRIEHTAKDQQGRVMATPRGAQSKTDRLDGAGYYLRTGKAFAKGVSGEAAVIPIKVRGGDHVAGDVLCKMVVTVEPSSGSVSIELAAVAPTPTNADGSVRLTGLMEKISKYLEASTAPKSTRTVREDVGGKAASIGKSILALVAEGFVVEEAGPNASKMFTSVLPYRQSEDIALNPDTAEGRF